MKRIPQEDLGKVVDYILKTEPPDLSIILGIGSGQSEDHVSEFCEDTGESFRKLVEYILETDPPDVSFILDTRSDQWEDQVNRLSDDMGTKRKEVKLQHNPLDIPKDNCLSEDQVSKRANIQRCCPKESDETWLDEFDLYMTSSIRAHCETDISTAHLIRKRLLVRRSWLEDDCVNFYLELLGQRDEQRNSKLSSCRCHFFNSFFYPRLVSEGGSYRYENVQRWTKRLGYLLSDCSKIFIPIHENYHWSLVLVDNLNRTIQYLDSIAKQNWDVLSNIRRYLVDELQNSSEEHWTLQIPDNIPQQQNNYDCGVFMLKMADLASKGDPFFFTQKDMPSYRKHIANAIRQWIKPREMQIKNKESGPNRHVISDTEENPKAKIYVHECLEEKTKIDDSHPELGLENATEEVPGGAVVETTVHQGGPEIPGLPIQGHVSDQGGMDDQEDGAESLRVEDYNQDLGFGNNISGDDYLEKEPEEVAELALIEGGVHQGGPDTDILGLVMKGHYEILGVDCDYQEPGFGNDISIYDYLENETKEVPDLALIEGNVPQCGPETLGNGQNDAPLDTQQQRGEREISELRRYSLRKSALETKSVGIASILSEKSVSIMRKWYDTRSPYPNGTDSCVQREQVQTWFGNERSERKRIIPQEFNFETLSRYSAESLEVLIEWVQNHGPVPTPLERLLLAEETNLSFDQVSDWFLDWLLHYRRKAKLQGKRKRCP